MKKIAFLTCIALYSISSHSQFGPVITLEEKACEINGKNIKFLKKGYKNPEYRDAGFKIFLKDSQKEILIKEASTLGGKSSHLDNFVCGEIPSILTKDSQLIFILGQMNAPFGDKSVIGYYNLKSGKLQSLKVTKNSFNDAFIRDKNLFLSVTTPRSDLIGNEQIEEYDMAPVFNVVIANKGISLKFSPKETVTNLKLSSFFKNEENFLAFFKIDKNFKERDLNHWLYLKKGKVKKHIKCIYATTKRELPKNFNSNSICI